MKLKKTLKDFWLKAYIFFCKICWRFCFVNGAFKHYVELILRWFVSTQCWSELGWRGLSGVLSSVSVAIKIDFIEKNKKFREFFNIFSWDLVLVHALLNGSNWPIFSELLLGLLLKSNSNATAQLWLHLSRGEFHPHMITAFSNNSFVLNKGLLQPSKRYLMYELSLISNYLQTPLSSAWIVSQAKKKWKINSKEEHQENMY